jgi:hypothetical protein
MVCLIVHQAIHEPNLSHNLVSTMEMRLNDVVVNATPKFQCEVPTDLSHTVMVMGHHEEVLIIPMFKKGVTSCFTMQKPTWDKLGNCDHFDVTYVSSENDPHCPSYASQEAAMTDANGLLRKVLDSHPRRRQVCSVDRETSFMQTKYNDNDAKLQAIDKTLEAGTLLASLKKHVNISEVNVITFKGGVDVATRY